MLNAFKVRQEVGRAEKLEGSEIARARRLLRISRRIRQDAKKLVAISYRLFLEGQRAQAARFLSANRRLMELNDDVRAKARQALRSSDTSTRREFAVVDKDLPCPDPVVACSAEPVTAKGGAL